MHRRDRLPRTGPLQPLWWHSPVSHHNGRRTMGGAPNAPWPGQPFSFTSPVQPLPGATRPLPGQRDPFRGQHDLGRPSDCVRLAPLRHRYEPVPDVPLHISIEVGKHRKFSLRIIPSIWSLLVYGQSRKVELLPLRGCPRRHGGATLTGVVAIPTTPSRHRSSRGRSRAVPQIRLHGHA